MLKLRGPLAVVYVLGSLVLGLGLVALLGYCDALDLKQLTEQLRACKPLFLGLILLSTLLHFAITALKWRLVAPSLTQKTPFWTYFFAYTCIAGLIGQVLPLLFSAVTVRSLAMRFHKEVSLTKGVASTVYDQFFDVLVSLALLPAALLAILGLVTLRVGGAISAVSLLIVGLAVPILGRQTGPLLIRICKPLPFLRRLLSDSSSDAVDKVPALLTDGVIVRLFVLSVVRYANLLFRCYLVVLALDLDIPFLAVAHAFPPVLLSFLLGITPANLGIAEWGWMGILGILGVPLATATCFALAARLLVLAVVVAINLIVFPWLLCRRLWKPPRSQDQGG